MKSTDNKMDKFHELIVDQFSYGGKKYAGSDNERESTDILVEKFSINWLYGTMAKYCFRYTNLARERDLLKVACYCYILWLKKGFHVKRDGLKVDVIDTNVEMKSLYFSKFISDLYNEGQKYRDSMEDEWNTDKHRLDAIRTTLYLLSNITWDKIAEVDLKIMYILCYDIWNNNYAEVERHDTDTHESRK